MALHSQKRITYFTIFHSLQLAENDVCTNKFTYLFDHKDCGKNDEYNY